MDNKTKIIIAGFILLRAVGYYYWSEQEAEAKQQYEKEEALRQEQFKLLDERNRIADSLLNAK
jgi:hypothetical protein